jgi:uncharacterized protein YdeI (YjbR/CyaY-like superfamily)
MDHDGFDFSAARWNFRTMATRDSRIDVYIAKSAEFAKPILEHLRGLVHAACPEVEESLKWSAPHFLHRGILCNMAAFKQHCSFGFWKGELVLGQGAAGAAGEGMGQFGRITALSDLPPDKVLTGFIRQAARLNETGIKRAAPARPKEKRTLRIPADLTAALKMKPRARAAFDQFSPSHKKEYVEWITGAKREETRKQRLVTAIAWMAEGKPRYWKYARC